MQAHCSVKLMAQAKIIDDLEIFVSKDKSAFDLGG